MTAYEVFSLTAEYDFAFAEETRLRDIYMEIKQLPVIGTFRVGQFIEPIGLETMTSDRFILFSDKNPMDTNFFPGYNPGAMFYNNLFSEDRGSWQIGAFRDDGSKDAGRSGGSPETSRVGSGFYNAVGRFTFLPYYANDGRCLVHLGAGYHHTSAWGTGAGPRVLDYSTTPSFRQGRTTAAFVDTGNIPCDSSDVFAAEFLTILGPLSVQAEVATASMNSAAVNGKIVDPMFWGAYAQIGYFLTGENTQYEKKLGRPTRVKVNEPFFMVRGEDGTLQSGWGAVQLVARYCHIDLTDSGVTGGAGDLFIGGVNWYWNPNFKVYTHYFADTRSQGAAVNAARGAGAGRGTVTGWMAYFAYDF